jgi:hypothetical protein
MVSLENIYKLKYPQLYYYTTTKINKFYIKPARMGFILFDLYQFFIYIIHGKK